MATVFISYSQKDKSIVKNIIDVIKNEGHHVNLDEEFLTVGDRLVPKIEENIQNSDFVIVFLSSCSIKSEWVSREICHSLYIELKTGKGKILPCRIEKFDDNLLPEALSKLNVYERLYLDFTRSDMTREELLKKLLQKLKSGSCTEVEQEYYMDLHIKKLGLSIYITGPNLNWDKNSRFKYSETLNGYLLFGMKPEDVGLYFKHFVVCNEEDADTVRDIISVTCEVTGVGSRDTDPGKWRVWFCRRDYPIVGNSRDNKWK